MSLPAAISPLRAAVLACTLWAVGVLLLTSIGLGFEASQNGWPPLVRPANLLVAGVLAVISYGFRFLRWHLLARRLAPSLGLLSSFTIGTIGFAFALTPGRAGEALKLLLLRRQAEVPVASSASVLVLEKVAEAAGFAVLAIGASLFLPWTEAFHDSLSLGVAGVLAGGCLVIALRRWLGPPLLAALAWSGRRLPQFRGLPTGAALEQLWADAIYGGERVLGPPGLVSALSLSVVARLCDGLVIYWVAALFGVDLPLAGAWFIIGSAGFVGGVTMLPGGAGAVEAMGIGLLLAFGSGPAAAVAVILISRIFIFWLWVALGLVLALRYSATGETSLPRVASEPQ